VSKNVYLSASHVEKLVSSLKMAKIKVETCRNNY